MWWVPLALSVLVMSLGASSLTIVIETRNGKRVKEAFTDAALLGGGALVFGSSLAMMFIASYPHITLF